MARTLASQLELARQCITHFGNSQAQSNEAIRALRLFARHATEYRNKYKSQPKVRKAIVTSGQYADELAGVLEKLVNDSKIDSRKVAAAKVRAIFMIEALSLSGYDETSIQLVEQWMRSIREMLPSPVDQPSQLAGLFDPQ